MLDSIRDGIIAQPIRIVTLTGLIAFVVGAALA